MARDASHIFNIEVFNNPAEYVENPNGQSESHINVQGGRSSGNQSGSSAQSLCNSQQQMTSKIGSISKHSDERLDRGSIEKVSMGEDYGPTDVVKTRKTSEKPREDFHLQDYRATGPIRHFNPTNVRMKVRWSDGYAEEKDPTKEIGILWRSRDNRKGRNSIVVPRGQSLNNLPLKELPQPTNRPQAIANNIWRMFSSFPYWDMAFWSAWWYTWGSALFVVDGLWAWIPEAFRIDLGGIVAYGVGLLFFFAAVFYEVGAVMAYLEAVNDGSFHGSAMRRFFEGREDEQKKLLDEKINNFFSRWVPTARKSRDEKEALVRELSINTDTDWNFRHHRDRRVSIYQAAKHTAPRRGGIDLGDVEEGESSEYMTWRWWPTWSALKRHHAREIGYLACATQLLGATLYVECGVVALPGILENLEPWEKNVAYWIPQIVASCCFLAASLMFVLETQEKWYKPQLNVLGWWIGAFAAFGSVGFLLCGCYGPATHEHYWAKYQSDLSSTWGSAAYLISAILQWYEALNKHPVEELFNEPGQMKSFMVHPI